MTGTGGKRSIDTGRVQTIGGLSAAVSSCVEVTLSNDVISAYVSALNSIDEILARHGFL